MTGRIFSQLKPKIKKTCQCGSEFVTSYSRQIHCSLKCANKYNPSRHWFSSRGYKYKQNYGMSVEDYNAMFAQQEGRCAICQVHQSELNTNLCVDHNHNTGQIRGLLCHRCNLALGAFKDSPEIVAAALEYVKLPDAH